MNFPAHVTIGVGIGALYGTAIGHDFLDVAVVTAATAFGSVLPDIDHKNSKLSQKMKITSFIVRLFTEHRKHTHSLLLNAIFFGLLYYLLPIIFTANFFTQELIIAVFIGVVSHLVLDFTTKMGVPLLYPLTSKYYSLKLFKSGGLGDIMFQFIGIGLVIYSILRF